MSRLMERIVEALWEHHRNYTTLRNITGGNNWPTLWHSALVELQRQGKVRAETKDSFSIYYLARP
jgi:hypothetical protein